jgi:hypothetical protein
MPPLPDDAGGAPPAAPPVESFCGGARSTVPDDEHPEKPTARDNKEVERREKRSILLLTGTR